MRAGGVRHACCGALPAQGFRRRRTAQQTPELDHQMVEQGPPPRTRRSRVQETARPSRRRDFTPKVTSRQMWKCVRGTDGWMFIAPPAAAPPSVARRLTRLLGVPSSSLVFLHSDLPVPAFGTGSKYSQNSFKCPGCIHLTEMPRGMMNASPALKVSFLPLLSSRVTEPSKT